MTTTPTPKLRYTIYEIRHNNPYVLNTYIGSTRNFFARLAVHRLRTKNTETYNCHLYQYIRGLGGWSQFTMSALEEIECESREEAEERESWWIKQRTANMNTYKVNTTRSQKTRERQRRYYADNRTRILDDRKQAYRYVPITQGTLT